MIKKEKILLIPSNIYNTIEFYKHNLPNLESGGIVLGRISPNQHIIVDELTSPTSKDKRGFYFFERDRGNAQKIINKRWKESNGEQIYLGEWHTHNENIPKPSKRDYEMIKNQLKSSIMEIDFLILIIIGQKENYFGIETFNGHQIIETSNNPFCYYIK